MAKVLAAAAAAAAGCALAFFTGALAEAHDLERDPSFELLGRYDTGLANVGEEVTAGETAALFGGRLFVTNATDISLDIVDVRNPRAPKLRKRIDLSPYGGQVNSVAVSWWGLVAVAVEADDKTDPGTIVFLGPEGALLATVEVGALPDMVTFTPDGRKLLVANEGEPNCYFDADDCPEPKDPEGTVSIIDVLPMRASPRVTTVGFGNVSLPPGVRIFGPNATQA
jgi:DNA-binding beta-propeller fold protein YncE